MRILLFINIRGTSTGNIRPKGRKCVRKTTDWHTLRDDNNNIYKSIRIFIYPHKLCPEYTRVVSKMVDNTVLS